MGDFRKLAVWERAHRLALATYRETRNFPKAEVYGLVAQTRRAAASVAANIVEGCGRDGDRELVRFLRIALGSACELEYHLLLARDLQFLSEEAWRSLTAEAKATRGMLASLITRISRAPKRPSAVS